MRKFSIVLLVWLTLSVSWITSACAYETVSGARALPLVPQDTHEPLKTELFQVDATELGQRRPLLLVHGLHGYRRRDCHWTKVIEHLTSDPDFQSTFKLYLVRYPTDKPLSEIVPDFKQSFVQLNSVTGGVPVTVLALSLGGNVVHQAMMDPAVDDRVEKVITFGTPFHGTPFFTVDWFQYSLLKNPSLALSRYYNTISYRLYFNRNRYISKDLRWDDADGFMPDVGHFKSKVKGGPSGCLTTSEDANHELKVLNAKPLPDKSKFITYGAYLRNRFVQKHGFSMVSRLIAPYLVLKDVVPILLVREHSVFRTTNRELSRVVCKPKPGEGQIRAYALNDGVCPLASALFLPNTSCASHPLTSEGALENVKACIDVGKARVFADADHIRLVDGSHRPFESKYVEDKLNPDEGKHTVFEWIIKDLMQTELATRRMDRVLSGADTTDSTLRRTE